MNLIDKIKLLFSEETQEVKFLDAKLVDGTIIRIEGDTFKVGDKVQVITEAGEMVDAPEGEHELEDGTVLVIDGESKITEIRTAEVVEETPTEDQQEDMQDLPVEEPTNDYEARVTALEDRMKALEEAMMMLVDKLQGNTEMMSALKVENETLKSENVKLASAPAAKPVSTKKFEKLDTTNSNPKSINRIESLLEKNTKK